MLWFSELLPKFKASSDDDYITPSLFLDQVVKQAFLTFLQSLVQLSYAKGSERKEPLLQYRTARISSKHWTI